MMRLRKRVWKAPGLPVEVEVSAAEEVRQEERSAEEQVRDRTVGRGDLDAASYFSRVPLVGAVLVAFGIVESEPWWLGFGLIMVAAGAWLSMRALPVGVSWRGLGWVVTECAVLGVALGVVLLLDLDGLTMWIAAGVAVFLAPWIATRVAGAREV